jgi:hypothetical protein
VVARLGAVPAWPDMAAELVIGARRQDGRNGDAARALGAGNLVKVFAFRGATHLMTPLDAGAYLALRGLEPNVGAAELGELLRSGLV